MNKQSLLLAAVLTFAVGTALYFSGFLQSPILAMTSTVKSYYHDTLEGISETIDEHFAQQRAIVELRETNQLYEKQLLVFHQIAEEYQKLLAENNSSIKTDTNVSLVRTLSYVRFGDTHKLWIEMEHFDPTQVYGLLHRGYAAGIVVAREDKPIALLNGDPKNSYAVTIGGAMAPGIIRGNNARQMIVEYIPTWIPVSIGDEVTTSGLDRIFISGIKVGKVVSVTKAQGYQSARVEPYFYGKNPAYFHVITKVR